MVSHRHQSGLHIKRAFTSRSHHPLTLSTLIGVFGFCLPELSTSNAVCITSCNLNWNDWTRETRRWSSFGRWSLHTWSCLRVRAAKDATPTTRTCRISQSFLYRLSTATCSSHTAKGSRASCICPVTEQSTIGPSKRACNLEFQGNV